MHNDLCVIGVELTYYFLLYCSIQRCVMIELTYVYTSLYCYVIGIFIMCCYYDNLPVCYTLHNISGWERRGECIDYFFYLSSSTHVKHVLILHSYIVFTTNTFLILAIHITNMYIDTLYVKNYITKYFGVFDIMS